MARWQSCWDTYHQYISLLLDSTSTILALQVRFPGKRLMLLLEGQVHVCGLKRKEATEALTLAEELLEIDCIGEAELHFFCSGVHW